MDTKALRQKILDLAIRGKLVPQDPNDEPASVLLERIREQKKQMVKEGKLKAKDIKNDTIIFVGEDNLHYEKFQDGTVKCIEDEIPFEVPEGWEWTRMDTIAFVTKLAGFEYTKNISPNLCENGIPLFKGKNVQNSTIVYEFEAFIPESVSDELQRSQITKKCILTPYVGTIGNIGIHNRSGKYHLGSNVGKIELYNEDVLLLEEYVVSYLQSGFGYQQLTKHMKATAQASISIEAIREVYLPIPPANEQLKIWETLSKALSLIECISNTEVDIANLIATTKSKILDLAIRGKLVPQDPNDEPASVLLERIRAEKEELIKQGKIKRDKKESIIFRGDDNSYYEIIDGTTECVDDDIPFEIPDNWEWIHLSDIVQVLNGDRGQNYPAKNKLQNTGIPFVSASNIDSGKVVSKDLLCMTEEQYDALGAGKLITGDIVYCIRGSLGKCGIFTMEKGAIASSLVIVRPIINDTIISEYIFYYLNSELSKREIAKYDNGSAQPNLAAKDFMRFLVPFPPLDEQATICNKLQEIYSYTMQIEKGIL